MVVHDSAEMMGWDEGEMWLVKLNNIIINYDVIIVINYYYMKQHLNEP